MHSNTKVKYYIHVVHDGNTDPTLNLFVMKLISVSVDTWLEVSL